MDIIKILLLVCLPLIYQGLNIINYEQRDINSFFNSKPLGKVKKYLFYTISLLFYYILEIVTILIMNYYFKGNVLEPIEIGVDYFYCFIVCFGVFIMYSYIFSPRTKINSYPFLKPILLFAFIYVFNLVIEEHIPTSIENTFKEMEYTLEENTYELCYPDKTTTVITRDKSKELTLTPEGLLGEIQTGCNIWCAYLDKNNTPTIGCMDTSEYRVIIYFDDDYKNSTLTVRKYSKEYKDYKDTYFEFEVHLLSDETKYIEIN